MFCSFPFLALALMQEGLGRSNDYGQARTFPNYSTDVVNETSQKLALRGEILTGLCPESPTKPYCCLKKSNFLRKSYVKELRIKSESRPTKLRFSSS
jgi:hypothetical protein